VNHSVPTSATDTNKISHQHVEALKDSSQAVIDLINSDIDSSIDPLSKNDANTFTEYDGGN
jgi:hypothetical protein